MLKLESVKEPAEFFGVLSHPIRLRILLLLYENVEMGYSDIRALIKIDDGLLNFHLRKIKNLVKSTPMGTYILSDEGKLAVEFLFNAQQRLLSALPGKREASHPKLDASIVIRRIVAFLVDVAIMFIATGLFLNREIWTALIMIFTGGITFPMVESVSVETVAHYSHLLFAVYLVFTVLEAYRGQTLGKYLMKIRVTKTDGERISLIESAVRNIGKVFLLPIDLLIGVVFYSRRGYLRFFDYYADLHVEQAKRVTRILKEDLQISQKILE